MPPLNPDDLLDARRHAWLEMLKLCLRELSIYEAEPLVDEARWTVERASAVAALREICEDFGDNDWPDNLYLADVIDKHLARHLHHARLDGE